jgi:hypothetical protein
MCAKKQADDPRERLRSEYARWDHLYKFGGSDPFYPDGMNLYLVRNHIINYKRMVEENYDPSDYPDAYHRELPPKVDQDYMARTEEILRNAKRTLAEYETDPDYKYIRAHRYDYTEKKQSKLLIQNVLGYVTWLKEAISEGDYVTMRQHERSENYIDLFKRTADTMRETPAEDVQISLFDAADVDLPADQEEKYSEDESIGMSL